MPFQRTVNVSPGDKFGHWLVLGEKTVERKGKKYRRVLCRCFCGVEREIFLGSLRASDSTNCGCQNRSKRKPYGRTYRIWKAMRTRCNNPNIPSSKYYSEKGITVCDRWESFENFLEDMGECPAGYSIDRIDSSGDYCPDNCRWADSTTQNNNKRSNRLITWRGETRTLTQWAKKLGFSVGTLQNRLNKPDSSIEQAFTEPVVPHRRNPRVITFQSKSLTVSQWAKELGLPEKTIRERLRMGMSIERALYNGKLNKWMEVM